MILKLNVNEIHRSLTVWGIATTPLFIGLLFLPQGRWLFPLLVPLSYFPEFKKCVVADRWRRAWLLGVAWAALLSISVIVLVHLSPEVAAETILRGEPYRQEMFGWIWEGVGREVSPSIFLPEHALHLSVFLVLAYLSGGYASLVLGALLTAYMSYFVGSYALAVHQPWVGSVVGWVPWSVVRVMAFILLGCLFAKPLLVRKAWPFSTKEYRLMALAALGIGVDIGLKILLAPSYGVWLRTLGS